LIRARSVRQKFYYRLGESEYDAGWLVALASIALWALGSFGLRFGLLGQLLLQVALYFALAFWNMWRSKIT